MKIWDKGINVKESVISFTVGDDYLLDMDLVFYDCVASKAHAKMLASIDLITGEELEQLLEGLNEIINLVKLGEFSIRKEEEDCHTAIENYLITKYGETGKKIHTGRSRNDQVLTALRLFEIDFIKEIESVSSSLVECLDELVTKFSGIPIPGYTHMRKAMPTTVGMWFDSFKEALYDDIKSFQHVLSLIDQSPLGTAAGFGVPTFSIDRELTCKELGFEKNIQNPMYAQITRGKFEGDIVNSCSQVMLTLNKLSTDLIMFSMTEFDFVNLPKNQCTGSSIMPQKVNPDVLEIIRGKYHDVISKEFQIKSLIGNLMSGYNRDVQLTKSSVMSALKTVLNSLDAMATMLRGVQINKETCQSAMTNELYATEKVNEMVKNGMSFRDAYKEVGKLLI